ncbi:hypothetical protein [Cupriavidus taiwanensis]|uniref:Uncharacterized protein n=1 Tax=Cupriavidus taiwanensis TaxID=164546 RepID=A0A375JCU3_9BURK|nr:hypothetical protein [Cupriavidus taiwanensis]SPS02927.1 conserved hypothetical protein [Cupriavidus taiwanensis]
MRKLQDPHNAELRAVLDGLLVDNIDITIREVARRHPELKNASAFTRNPVRMGLIDEAIRRQCEVRTVAAGLHIQDATTIEDARKQDAQIKELQRQVKHLVAAHAGLIRSVQLAGGMSALERFWQEYKSIGDTVRALDAVSDGAVVLTLP